MTTISPSRVVREGIEDAFALEFNAALAAACGAMGITVFGLNWAQDPQQPRNVFGGNRTLGQLVELEEPDFFPAAVTWWVGPGLDSSTEKPRTFSGIVGCGWRFWLAVKGKYATGLTEMREAVEAALVATLLDLGITGVTYRKDLTWGEPVGQQWEDQDVGHVGWLQEIEFRANFEVNV